MSNLTQEWATAYCNRLMIKHQVSFPFLIGRKKTWGGIDATVSCIDDNSFFKNYKDFNDHPRCVAIFLITKEEKLISI